MVYGAFVDSWPHKHNGICFSVQRHLISNKEKGNISFFLIRYETALDRKTYTIMLVIPKDDKRAKYH